MNHKDVYDSIILRAKARGLDKSKLVGYYEYHHVIPSCIGGGNEKTNIVCLTAKEHFICHALLCFIYPLKHKLLYAFHCMKSMDPTGKRYFSGSKYEKLRIRFIESISFYAKHLGTKSSDVLSLYPRIYLSEEERRITLPFCDEYFLIPENLCSPVFKLMFEQCKTKAEFYTLRFDLGDDSLGRFASEIEIKRDTKIWIKAKKDDRSKQAQDNLAKHNKMLLDTYGISNPDSITPEELLNTLDSGSLSVKKQNNLIKLFPQQFSHLIKNKMISATCWAT